MLDTGISEEVQEQHCFAWDVDSLDERCSFLHAARLEEQLKLADKIIDTALMKCSVEGGCTKPALHYGTTLSMWRCDEHVNVKHHQSDPMAQFHYADALREYLRTRDDDDRD